MANITISELEYETLKTQAARDLRGMEWNQLLYEGLGKFLQTPKIINAIGREHTEQTPQRYIKAMLEMFDGVNQAPETALSTLFPANEDEMIHVKEMTFFSNCAHHLVPFFGKMSFAYIPDKSFVGLSKIPRLVEVYAKRPQVQEHLTSQIVQAFQDIVQPKGCALMVRAYHMCCMSRGIKQPTSYTETTALRGIFKDNTEVKNEWLLSVNSQNWKLF